MNRLKIALLPALFLCLIAFGYAQQPESGQQPDSDKQEETKHPQDAVPPHKPAEASPSRESRPQQEKPPKPEKPEATKPPKEQPGAGQQEHAQGEHDRTAQKDQADTNGKNEKNEKNEKNDKNDKNDKNGRTAHIPDSQFKAKFGHQHSFAVNRVVTQTTIVPRQTQFAYGGYTFVFLDPWPAAWMFTDDCYIDYVDDQYFLFDPLHPEIRVALIIAE